MLFFVPKIVNYFSKTSCITIHKLLIYLWFEMATPHKHGGAGRNRLAVALYVMGSIALTDFADGVCRISASGDAREYRAPRDFSIPNSWHY
jgi:hypothetical protein